MDAEQEIIDGVDDYNCPICQGKGCTICSFTGTIQVRSQAPEKASTRIIVDASEYDKDQMIMQIGKVVLHDPSARKEYSAALTYYKALQDMKKVMESDEFKDMFEQVIEELKKDRIDGLDSVSNALDIIYDLHRNNLKIHEKVKHMATSFEIALEVMNRAHKSKNEEIEATKEELGHFRDMFNKAIKDKLKKLPLNLQTPNIVRPTEVTKPNNNDYNEDGDETSDNVNMNEEMDDGLDEEAVL